MLVHDLQGSGLQESKAGRRCVKDEGGGLRAGTIRLAYSVLHVAFAVLLRLPETITWMPSVKQLSKGSPASPRHPTRQE